MTKKETIRNSLLKQRTQLSVDEMNRLSNLICDRFLSHEMPSYQRVASYLPTKHEVNTLPIHDYLFKKRFLYMFPPILILNITSLRFLTRRNINQGNITYLNPLIFLLNNL